MPNRAIELFVIDVFISIDKVKRFSEHCETSQHLIDDEKTLTATLRELEIIGEAIKHILNYPPYQHLITEQWRIIVDFRNYIAHEYFGINYNEVFEIIRVDLLEFEQELLCFFKVIDDDNLREALVFVKEEYSQMNRAETIRHLESLEAFLKSTNHIYKP